MAIRPARSIRDPNKVAWTRFSRSKPRRSYIKTMPHADLHQFRMGVLKDDFDTTLHLSSEVPIILRDNAIESARQTANKYIETKVPGNYYFVVRVYPHHIIRENKMISGAGADRLQKGMRQSFGRPTDRAARLGKGTALFTVHTYSSNVEHVKKAFTRATRKLSGKYSTIVEKAA
ncbi:50S ribosomal protein L16 [Candidatus Micrarchaeota archaeon]|nr:50S ribosomal protein L16 [Candidatus Micrarchaeota archaeon]